jgi:hypothetical protein
MISTRPCVPVVCPIQSRRYFPWPKKQGRLLQMIDSRMQGWFQGPILGMVVCCDSQRRAHGLWPRGGVHAGTPSRTLWHQCSEYTARESCGSAANCASARRLHHPGRWRTCFRKAPRSTRWHLALIPNCLQPRRSGLSSAPRDGGTRLPVAFPLRKWLPRLKRW